LRHRDLLKRGRNAEQVALSDVALMSVVWSKRLLALDAALNKRGAEDERKIRVVDFVTSLATV